MSKKMLCGVICVTAVVAMGLSGAWAADGGAKPADMSKPVKVFILMGQSNMVGLGRITGKEGALETAVKEKKKYPYLVDEAGNWSERKDVRFVRVMQGRGGGGMQQFNNECMTVAKCKTIGPEFGLAHFLGDAIDAPVMILKSCIGNRSLGWDLLPPGSERYRAEVTERSGQKVTKVFAGYKDRPDCWVMDQSKGTATAPPPWLDKTGKPIDWYAGKQYDDDVSYAKKVLSELDKYYPGAAKYEVAGFFFWQGEKDCGNAVHAGRYEQNLVHFIKQLRKDFNSPDAKFVLATLGETTKGSGGNGGMVLNAQLAVDGTSGKHPEFKGNVATIYTNPMAQGGSGNGHYGGKAEVYMDVGEAMGKAMVDLLKDKQYQDGSFRRSSYYDLRVVQNDADEYGNPSRAWSSPIWVKHKPVAAEGEWTRFRGPNGSGISEAATMPARWTERDYNWKIKLPGVGDSSPVVWGERVFVTSGEPETAKRLILCLHSADGRILWQREYPSRTYARHRDNGYSTATPAVDAEGVVVTWTTPEQVVLLALDLDGREVWRRELGPFVMQSNCSGISPIIYEDLVVLANDQDDLRLDPDEKSPRAGTSFLIAVERRTGKTRWQVPRPTTMGGFGTPCVRQTQDGRDELIFVSIARGVTGVDAQTGRINWELDLKLRGRTVASPMLGAGLVFAGAGWSDSGERCIAVSPGSQGQAPKIAYEIKQSVPMVPTPLVKDGRLFLWSDKGIVSCLKAATGELIWRERVGGSFYGSPVWVGGRLYCIAKNGDVVVLAAADKFELLSRVPLGEMSYATPAAAGGVMYLRTQSQLFSLGGKKLDSSAARPQDWYYREGPLRGSLKSDNPLPLYDSNPEHLWNRLFAAFYIRRSELPSRPEYPHDSTKLDEWDWKLRKGELPLGPVVTRIEGGDIPSFPAWQKTRHYSDPATFDRTAKLLDEFIDTHAERLIDDPLKRAFLQRDLWAVFDHLVGQNIARFNDPDLARRYPLLPDYQINTSGRPDNEFGPEELQADPARIARREPLCRKLAVIIKRLALPKSVIEALPDTYAAAIRSGRFASEHDFDPRRDYLPPGLLTRPDEWVEIDTSPEPLRRNQEEGQHMLLGLSIRGRSYYRIFWRFPGGRRAVEEYLDYLGREGMDWEKTGREGHPVLKPNLRQIPAGTEAAIVQFMLLPDDRLDPVPTQVVELVHLFVYKNVAGTPDPQTNTGRGLNAIQYVARRRLLFDGLKQGGLDRNADDAPTYRTLLNGSRDWGAFGRQQSVVQTCLHCHLYWKDKVGIFSLNSTSCYLPERMQGVVIPMGSGPTRTLSRAERTARWKARQEDYLRLVEYARRV